MSSRRLCLNSDKTVFTWLGSPRKLDMFSITSFNLLGNIIHGSDTVRDLGVIHNRSPNCGKYISKLTQTCSYQLHQLRRIYRCLSPQVAEQLVHAFVTCCFDNCNSILYDCFKLSSTPGCWFAPLRSHQPCPQVPPLALMPSTCHL